MCIWCECVLHRLLSVQPMIPLWGRRQNVQLTTGHGADSVKYDFLYNLKVTWHWSLNLLYAKPGFWGIYPQLTRRGSAPRFHRCPHCPDRESVGSVGGGTVSAADHRRQLRPVPRSDPVRAVRTGRPRDGQRRPADSRLRSVPRRVRHQPSDARTGALPR